MHVWLLQTGEPIPWPMGAVADVRKMRTALLAEALIARGHEVTWWTSAFCHQSKKPIYTKDTDVQIGDRFFIKALKGKDYRRNISLLRYYDHAKIARKFRCASARMSKPDIIVASMPCHLLASEGVLYACENSIPVIVDIRDLWPDTFVDVLKFTLFKKCVSLVLERDRSLLSDSLRRADSLVAVSNSYLAWALERAGRETTNLDKVYYLGYKNRSSVAAAVERTAIDGWTERLKGKKVFLFIGTFGSTCDLNVVVKTAKLLKKANVTDIQFVIAGSGDHEDETRREARGLDNVAFTGWVGKSEIEELLDAAYVGLLPYNRCAPQSIPNKPFEYLSAGLPLLSSLTGEMSELISSHGLGLNYESGNEMSLCREVIAIASDKGLHDRLSRSAFDFFTKHCDADTIYDDYAKHVEMIVSERQKERAGIR